ncbi:ATP-grasp domain-containing protein [Paraflavitalea sp. CAU 1676]|uniref:ATP-grasp domain-containing protein n=1 Tax=Paraflavitalea sp. CAU 1676 TaxID=3032598 RepID=UPI0023DC8306|nr:ATP-grasp domain-containing protein [Paraflavitalea sp. CAU 1676]MDF2193775.1 ATP-grasp domain-containing protein [Paraflavitalea sp. CAU 1676]
MNKGYNDIQWVIQRNLTNSNDLQQLKTACSAIGVDVLEIDIIPFTSQLPDFSKDKQSIFYGSTTMGKLVMANAGLQAGFFFDPAAFSIANYLDKWGTHMLNHGAQVTSFNELMSKDYEADKLLFIRPDDDSKSFSGEVKQYSELRQWFDHLKTVENTDLSPDSPIIVSEPYHIHFEWRLWIVNKRVVAASKYREDFRLKKERGCPPEVIRFAEQRCLEYTPHDLFVMDICETGGNYYIVECGCLNSAGFYNADIIVIVSEVTEAFARRNK